MKAFILKNKIILSVIAVIGLMSFAGARYEIYRLSPAPKNGQIIGEKDGKWQATSASSLFNEFYNAEAESYAYWGTAYDNTLGEYVWAGLPIPGWLESTSLNSYNGILTTDAKGRSFAINHSQGSAGSFMVDAHILYDTTGITVDVCCRNDSTFNLVFSRADTLLKNYSGNMVFEWRIITQTGAPEIN